MQSARSLPAGTASFRAGLAVLEAGDACRFYAGWPAPACIIADGPYGLGKFPGEPPTPAALAGWYAPHVAAWSAAATPATTLWFWCSELGWAQVHGLLDRMGWQYEECCVWDKGLAHVAGNCNSRTIRGLPVVTEVAVRYTRKLCLTGADGTLMPVREWMRAEWCRSGLPLSHANAACGVRNAATRKYLTRCHLWYFPPPEALVAMAGYCTRHGRPAARPYFSLDGQTPPDAAAWAGLRAKWHHVHGLTNVWREPPVHGSERVRVQGHGSGALHANQKPLMLMERQIRACTDPGDVVWEPFGGLCSAAVAALRLGRRAFAAEINPGYHAAAAARLCAAAGAGAGKEQPP